MSSYVVDRYNDIAHWIEPYVPEAVKKKVSEAGIQINKKIESLKSLVFKTANKNPTEPATKKLTIVVKPATSVVKPGDQGSLAKSVKVAKPATSVVKPIQHKIVFKLTNHAVRNVVRQFSYEVEGQERDASSFLNRARDGVIKILRENRNKKVYFVLTCEMECASILTDEVITRIVPFSSTSGIVLESTNLEKFYNRAKEAILENMVKYNKMGSNCVVSAIMKMEINMIKYNPICARSYIPLNLINPDLTKKKAIINIKNEDNECFKWCVTRALNMKSKNNERVDEELIEKSKELNWDGIDFPVLLKHIKKFEKNNEDISIYVFVYKKKKVRSTL